MTQRISALTFLCLMIALPAWGQTITTSFSTSDGFVTGDNSDVTLMNSGFEITFSGGQQQQAFDGSSYNAGPDGYLFFNGTFGGVTGNTDVGTIDFNRGVNDVSFFLANRANGAGVTVRALGVDDTTILGSEFVTQTSIQNATNPSLTQFTSQDFGGALIGSLEIDLPGPANNPPYVAAIDTFSATAIPEPSSILVMGAIGTLAILRRRKNL